MNRLITLHVGILNRRARSDAKDDTQARVLVAGHRDEWNAQRAVARELGLLDDRRLSLGARIVRWLRGARPAGKDAWGHVQRRDQVLKERGHIVETDAYRASKERTAHAEQRATSAATPRTLAW